jgi:hypothetical protein
MKQHWSLFRARRFQSTLSHPISGLSSDKNKCVNNLICKGEFLDNLICKSEFLDNYTIQFPTTAVTTFLQSFVRNILTQIHNLICTNCYEKQLFYSICKNIKPSNLNGKRICQVDTNVCSKSVSQPISEIRQLVKSIFKAASQPKHKTAKLE